MTNAMDECRCVELGLDVDHERLGISEAYAIHYWATTVVIVRTDDGLEVNGSYLAKYFEATDWTVLRAKAFQRAIINLNAVRDRIKTRPRLVHSEEMRS